MSIRTIAVCIYSVWSFIRYYCDNVYSWGSHDTTLRHFLRKSGLEWILIKENQNGLLSREMFGSYFLSEWKVYIHTYYYQNGTHPCQIFNCHYNNCRL